MSYGVMWQASRITSTVSFAVFFLRLLQKRLDVYVTGLLPWRRYTNASNVEVWQEVNGSLALGQMHCTNCTEHEVRNIFRKFFLSCLV
jgi:hypothetical protein